MCDAYRSRHAAGQPHGEVSVGLEGSVGTEVGAVRIGS